MRSLLVFSTLALSVNAYAQLNSLIGKTWAYKKVVIIYRQDSLVVFDSDSAKNHWYLGRINMTFKLNHTYSGADINGQPQNGIWSTPNLQTLTVDSDTNQVLLVTSKRFSTSTAMRYRDTTTDISGTLFTEFYAILEPDGICESIQSGNWNDLTIWSCGREPTINDVVVINPGHTVTVSTASAQAQRIIYNGGVIKFSGSVAKLFVKGDG